MLKLDNMLLIGSEQRKAGKTTLACELIKKFSKNHDIAAIKITTLSKEYPNHTINSDGECWENGYYVVEENNKSDKTDTSKFLSAGAQQSFWLRVFDDNLLEGFTAVLNQIGEGSIIICEATSLVKFVKPGVFVMFSVNPDSEERKKHISDLERYTSFNIRPDVNDFDGFPEKISLKSGKWELNSSGSN